MGNKVMPNTFQIELSLSQHELTNDDILPSFDTNDKHKIVDEKKESPKT